ncbi:hypothetical protein [Pectobacterium quasiaquaticum]|uniref:hypothetical protein n=1 Tax=Pectobacterium quasiaquaticum TaxID=2774015 RepID=UPI001CF7BCAF|nr:hypothetical protein [Pectobacterium quasiaquaticum]
MDDYIYRIDTAVKLKKIQDGFFRAKRWENRNGIDYPHKLLKDHYAELAPAEGVYLMCFYSSQQKAEISLKKTSPISVIVRFHVVVKKLY